MSLRCFTFFLLVVLTGSSWAGPLVAHWRLDEAAQPFAGEVPLGLDFNTTAPLSVAGVDGSAVRLRFASSPGVSTRLVAYGAAVQRDSFGFSFWVRPVDVAPFENLIGKEMQATAIGPAFTRVAWQVQVSGDGRIEFVLRGANRVAGDFFGSVLSSATIPLHTDLDRWIHIAGGYDSATGKLTLNVDGSETTANETPDAQCSDGGAFAVGTMVNGAGFVAFAAMAEFDDVQLYDAPLSGYDAAYLRMVAGREVTQRFAMTGWTGNPSADLFATFASTDGWYYSAELSTDLINFTPAVTVRGVGSSTTVVLPKAAIDGVLGPAPRSRLFTRTRAHIEDAADFSLGLPPVAISPFPNTGAYVPQYHFSLPGAGVGDPCGIVRWQNSYHLFTWDHASSADLVAWNFHGWPMRDGAVGTGQWTGSVVVDKLNTSGFGSLANPAMVAIYTIHDNATGKESIGISSSTNGHDLYQFAGNPVLSTADQVFRDPDVFWHAPTNRWIMLVARSEARSISFYSSTDLKSWQYLSAFGPVGAHAEIWEVPGLFEVPIRGMGNQKKWMLSVSAGSNKVQYFTGQFDGTAFTPDAATQSFLDQGTGLDGDVFANFEAVTYAELGWTRTGSAFAADTGWRGQPGQPASGFLGNRLASSYVNGDFHTGSTLTSGTFTITKNCINFLIAGGNHPGQTCINLLIGGNVVRTTSGDDSDLLRWAGWNVADRLGQTAQIQIVDDFGGFWGRIYIDHILFSNTLDDQRREHAKWVDFGSDFYAPRVVRDYDGADTATTWLGWIGNWQYEAQRPDPLTWGKGAESIFRKLLLAPSPAGHELIQRPIAAQQRLRGPVANTPPFTVLGITPITDFAPLTNTYELEATFERGAHIGINLCVGGGNKLVLGFDGTTNNVWLDRTLCGNVSFHPAFANVTQAPLKSTSGPVKFRIFIDQSSVEVFVNDGERVLTSQIYPNAAHRGIEVFSTNTPTALLNFKAWPLASIWQ